MNDAQLIDRLAGTDAYEASTPLPDEIWTPAVALQVIERRTDMQIQEQPVQVKAPPPSRRKWLVPALAGGVAAVIAIVVAVSLLGGSDESLPDVGDTSVPTTAPSQTTVPESATLAPLEVAEALNDAIVAGDWEAARALYSDDATYTQLDDGFGFDFIRHGKELGGSPLRDNMLLTSQTAPGVQRGLTTIYPPFDWDGDSVVTAFDDLASLVVADHSWGVTDFYSCTETDPTTVVCDLLLEGHALVPDGPPPVTDTFTVVDGLITHQEYDTTVSRFDDPFGIRVDYLGYVEENQPELEATLFSPSRLGELRMTPDTAETHRQLIAEWRAQP